jgi:hypothetical protein
LATKKKRVRLTLPAGAAYYPNLDAPRQFMRDGKPEGDPKFDTGVIYEGKALETVRSMLDEAAETLGFDSDDRPKLPLGKNKKTGDMVFKAHSGKDFKPIIVDAKLNPLPAGVRIGGGSIIKVDVTLDAYEGFGGGITAYLNGVQVLKFEEDTFGKPRFDAEEGYQYENEAEDSVAAGAFTQVNAEEMHNF